MREVSVAVELHDWSIMHPCMHLHNPPTHPPTYVPEQGLPSLSLHIHMRRQAPTHINPPAQPHTSTHDLPSHPTHPPTTYLNGSHPSSPRGHGTGPASGKQRKHGCRPVWSGWVGGWVGGWVSCTFAFVRSFPTDGSCVGGMHPPTPPPFPLPPPPRRRGRGHVGGGWGKGGGLGVWVGGWVGTQDGLMHCRRAAPLVSSRRKKWAGGWRAGLLCSDFLRDTLPHLLHTHTFWASPLAHTHTQGPFSLCVAVASLALLYPSIPSNRREYLITSPLHRAQQPQATRNNNGQAPPQEKEAAQ